MFYLKRKKTTTANGNKKMCIFLLYTIQIVKKTYWI